MGNHRKAVQCNALNIKEMILKGEKHVKDSKITMLGTANIYKYICKLQQSESFFKKKIKT